MSFVDLGLKPELLRAVQEKGYSEPTPIQAQAIPAVLSGSDVLAGAQTGTGKTAAFVLPILQKLGQAAGRAPRALVLTPTRELAAQIAESARAYGKYVGVRTAVVFGGVSINPQIDALEDGCDLLVATPGRLLDLAQQGALDLHDVKCFVLDEADRMLDMGFIQPIRRIIKLLPQQQRQNLLFSATYSEDIRELAARILRNPATIEVAARNATADRVDQQIYRVPKDHKRHLLAHLIEAGSWHQVLVFTRTKHGANRLAQQLQSNGILAAAIHGNKSQGARVRALSDFKANKITALVATEVAARGLDIKELPHVVNYELPNVPEDYVHRIGRTARAGGSGSAVSLVSPDESPLLKDIERLLRRALPVATLPQFAIVNSPAGDWNSSQTGQSRGGDGRNFGRPIGNEGQVRRRGAHPSSHRGGPRRESVHRPRHAGQPGGARQQRPHSEQRSEARPQGPNGEQRSDAQHQAPNGGHSGDVRQTGRPGEPRGGDVRRFAGHGDQRGRPGRQAGGEGGLRRTEVRRGSSAQPSRGFSSGSSDQRRREGRPGGRR